jgi:uncharacterized protein (TIGR02145 family)
MVKKKKALTLLVSIAMLVFVTSFQKPEPTTCPSVKIGTQTWMTKNLNVAVFRNGDPIPQAKTIKEWESAGNSNKPAWCYYDFNPANDEPYGKLYNWFAINDFRGIAPTGWHVPNDDEWFTLEEFLGGFDIAGAKMKAQTGWKSNGNGNDSSGFNGCPSGFCNDAGQFNSIGAYGYWWSTSEEDAYNAFARNLNCFDNLLFRANSIKGYGYSVRCLRD